MNPCLDDIRVVPRNPLGAWIGDPGCIAISADDVRAAIRRVDAPLFVVAGPDGTGVATEGTARLHDASVADGLPLIAYAGQCTPGHLGSEDFKTDHGVRYAYVAGAMANGIASVDLVEAMARAGHLSFFGSAGLSVERVTAAVGELKRRLTNGEPYGFNLIHSPNEPHVESAIVELYLREGIRLVEASAFLRLTLPIVRYRLHGIHLDRAGNVIAPNRVIAKVSRVEVATRFMSPPPEDMVRQLVSAGELTEDQARMAEEIPLAQDVTAEADSGGHTDNRPAVALLPTMLALRDRMQAEFGYAAPLRVGLGGGISTPLSAAAAFAMGAAYIVTGSVNQACVESGTSDLVRHMLAEAEQADSAMAPAADMFEMGVQVQVLKRGTMFPMRAAKLYELYRRCASMDEIPGAEREKLEKTVFRAPLEEIWRQTELFFRERDPRQIERANKDARHKMALVFRWYLGQSSNWANAGIADRKMDYQVWCGPAMGAFNEWVRGTYLESAENRSAPVVAREILDGAAVLHRINVLRAQGVEFPSAVAEVRPVARDHSDQERELMRESA